MSSAQVSHGHLQYVGRPLLGFVFCFYFLRYGSIPFSFSNPIFIFSFIVLDTIQIKAQCSIFSNVN